MEALNGRRSGETIHVPPGRESFMENVVGLLLFVLGALAVWLELGAQTWLRVTLTVALLLVIVAVLSAIKRKGI